MFHFVWNFHFLFYRRDYLIFIIGECFANYGIIYELISHFNDCVFRVLDKVSKKAVGYLRFTRVFFIMELT